MPNAGNNSIAMNSATHSSEWRGARLGAMAGVAVAADVGVTIGAGIAGGGAASVGAALGVGVGVGDGAGAGLGVRAARGVRVELGSGWIGTTRTGLGTGVGVGVGTGIGIGVRGAMLKLSRPGIVCGSWPLAGGGACVFCARAGVAPAARAISARRRRGRVMENGGKRIVCPVAREVP
jgi:hypothetical protein